MHSENPSWKIKFSYFLSEIMILLQALFLITMTIISRFLSGLKQAIEKEQVIAEIELFVILALILVVMNI